MVKKRENGDVKLCSFQMLSEEQSEEEKNRFYLALKSLQDVQVTTTSRKLFLVFFFFFNIINIVIVIG